MKIIDFTCPGCSKLIVGANLLQIWYAAYRPCCSYECQQRVLEVLRDALDTAVQELINEQREATAKAA